jgi:hypothetical protein
MIVNEHCDGSKVRVVIKIPVNLLEYEHPNGCKEIVPD